MNSAILSILVTSILFIGFTQSNIAQEKKEPYRKEIKKEEPHKLEQKKNSKDEVAGKTKDGKIVYAGPKGGFYYFTSGGNKSYIKESELVGAKIVGKTKDGRNIYEGPRGGRYYYNSKNEKIYLKKN